MTTGRSRVTGSDFRSRQAWYPFMRGIMTSRMMSRTSSRTAFSMASRPSRAVITS